MKGIYLLQVLLLCNLAMLFESCSLFKKTTRSSHKESQSSLKQSEANMLLLKNANRETLAYTFWNDSGFCRFEQIKEQIDLTKSAQLKTEEKQEVKQQSKIKEKEPVKIWFYICTLIVIAAAYCIYKNWIKIIYSRNK